MKNIAKQLFLANQQFEFLRYELKSHKEELALLAEYKELLAEAILTGNKELVVSIKRRTTILEAGLASSKN